MGYFSRQAHTCHGVHLYRGFSPQLYLKDIHLADQDIRFKLIGVSNLYGYRALHHLVATLNVHPGNEAVKGGGNLQAGCPSLVQIILGILYIFLSIGYGNPGILNVFLGFHYVHLGDLDCFPGSHQLLLGQLESLLL